ncbi:histidine kinase [Flavobacteriaceae bacterium MAR_2010_72]|nr:histidine kinase [Flavobacteriaceae bacterium MAR_2010_72]TVZ59729.1 histidine kinase [Flavobacteriaceae bacterium MAR_2010_105]
MSVREFILSDKNWYRFGRHLLFWFFWGGYFAITRQLNPVIYMTTGKFPEFWKSIIETFFFLFPQTFLVYPTLYFILPYYVFRQKYVQGALWFIFFYFVALLVHAIVLINIPWDKVPWISTAQLFLTTTTLYQKFFMAYLGSIQGSITAVALASSFKMFKHYYLKSLRNQQLQKENSEAQLRLLMAQVQPHFMFNTLNNIYSQAQEESPKSAKMILELSHILRYILDEGKKDWVPLENELQMVVDYLNLEKIRYDNKLDLHYSFPNSTGDQLIAPLLLLPLVENCFKHGASKMIDNPWINIKSELQGTTFSIKLMNGKKNMIASDKYRKGTGIENVRRRLALLYPNKHALEVKDDVDVFIVNLNIELDSKDSVETNMENESFQEYETI